jgi:hypothetical protein
VKERYPQSRTGEREPGNATGEIPNQTRRPGGCEAGRAAARDAMVIGNILVAARVTALLAFISAPAWANSINAATILYSEANGTVGASVSGFDIQTPDVVVFNPKDVLVGDFFLREFTSNSPNSAGGGLLPFLFEPEPSTSLT